MTSILGISAYYHDSAAALILDGKIIAAAQEERFSRKKHEILVEKLDLNSEIDSKVYELTKKSYVKLFDLSPLEVKNSIEYFYNIFQNNVQQYVDQRL